VTVKGTPKGAADLAAEGFGLTEARELVGETFVMGAVFVSIATTAGVFGEEFTVELV
jgi:hypothetical protein